MKFIASLVAVFVVLNLGRANETIEVIPLTNQILIIHFDEGFVQHALAGESRRNETTFATPLDVTAATQLSNYVITSTSDNAFINGISPSSIARKTKPTDFAALCETFDRMPFYDDSLGCINASLDHADEHWIYLFLDNPVLSGNEYTIRFQGDLSDRSDIVFRFDERSTRSEALHVNNIAYSTEAPKKYGYVYHWMGDGGGLDLAAFDQSTFGLIDETTGQTVFSGNLTFRKDRNTPETFQDNPNETPNQNFSGADVYECDFSSFSTPGKYRLYVEGIGASHSFEISCNAFRKPFEAVMKGLYLHRSGIDLMPPTAESDRPAPHNPAQTPGFSGRLKYTTTTICEVSNADASNDDLPLWESGILGSLDATWGWYQDAGDWDAYPTHFRVPIMLMFTFEHFGPNFTDNQLSIPESGNDIPDILDEARWLIRFYKRIKDETEAKGWTTGGVPGGRIFGDLFGNDLGASDIIRGSWQDTDRDWIASGEEPLVTFLYAAVAAHYQWLLTSTGHTDPEGIDWAAEAAAAYDWADQRYDINYSCHDLPLVWTKNYAAAALLRLTGEAQYNMAFEASWNDAGVTPATELVDWAGYGAYIYYATDPASTTSSLATTIEGLIEKFADFLLLDNVDNRSCRWGGNIFFPMLVGQPTTPLIFEGVMGYALLKATNPAKSLQYWETIHNTADYFLGNNPLNMTWISGLGERNPEEILQLDAWATGDGSSKNGIVPYGPWLRQGWDVMGPFHHQWPEQFVYPEINSWPGHERWFEQRPSPLSCEYTVHQNSINAAVVYGALSNAIDCSAVTGVPSIEVQEDCIRIFPNPTDQFFTIQGNLPRYNVTILNLSGQVILNLSNVGSETIIDTNNLGSGTYFVNVAHESNPNLCVRTLVKI